MKTIILALVIDDDDKIKLVFDKHYLAWYPNLLFGWFPKVNRNIIIIIIEYEKCDMYEAGLNRKFKKMSKHNAIFNNFR